jgi:hypothetical protein
LRNALVLTTPRAHDSVLRPSGRANADFLAHLIAMAVQAPQTRTRRRAEPAQAVAAYRARGPWPMAPGGSVRRSL